MEQPLSTQLSSPISLVLLRKAIALVDNRSIDYGFFTSPEARILLKDTHRIVGIQLAEFPSLFSKDRTNSIFCLAIDLYKFSLSNGSTFNNRTNPSCSRSINTRTIRTQITFIT